MGYESRVYIIREYKPCPGEKLGFGSNLAMFNLGQICYEEHYGKPFYELFDKERTCEFYSDDGKLIEEDRYGSPIRKADNEDVLKWLRASCKEEPYWRAQALLSYLEALEKTGVSYSIYHFGY